MSHGYLNVFIHIYSYIMYDNIIADQNWWKKLCNKHFYTFTNLHMYALFTNVFISVALTYNLITTNPLSPSVGQLSLLQYCSTFSINNTLWRLQKTADDKLNILIPYKSPLSLLKESPYTRRLLYIHNIHLYSE